MSHPFLFPHYYSCHQVVGHAFPICNAHRHDYLKADKFSMRWAIPFLFPLYYSLHWVVELWTFSHHPFATLVGMAISWPTEFSTRWALFQFLSCLYNYLHNWDMRHISQALRIQPLCLSIMLMDMATLTLTIFRWGEPFLFFFLIITYTVKA